MCRGIVVLKQGARELSVVSGQRKYRLAVLRGGRIRWVERRTCRLQSFARSRSYLVGIASVDEWTGRYSAQQTDCPWPARNLSAAVTFCSTEVSQRRAIGNRQRENCAKDFFANRQLQI